MPGEPTPAPSEMEQRIAALVSARDSAVTQAEQIAQQNQLLASRLANLENTITTLAAPRQPASPPKDAGRPATGGDDIVSVVRAIVQEAIDPLVKTVNKTAAESELSKKHSASYQRAVADNPDLQNPESALYRVSQELWAKRPDLTKLDDAPLVIATMARGIVGAVKAADPAIKVGKQQATATPPASAARRADNAGSELDQVIEAARSQVNKGIEGSEGPSVIANLFRAELTQRFKEE